MNQTMHTNGQRIYAIGDIHGCRDEFAQMQVAIAADLLGHLHPDPLVIALGDDVDHRQNLQKPALRIFY